MNNELDAREIDSSRSDVCGNDDIDGAVARFE
jgi:hypothetical protein